MLSIGCSTVVSPHQITAIKSHMDMSFRTDGLNAEIGAATVSINVEKDHRLLQLANALD
jgi:antitoxin component HigA of HigAB toxin-antitoxin module